ASRGSDASRGSIVRFHTPDLWRGSAVVTPWAPGLCGCSWRTPWAPAFAGVTCGDAERAESEVAARLVSGVPLPHRGEGTGVGDRSGHQAFAVVAARGMPSSLPTTACHPLLLAVAYYPHSPPPHVTLEKAGAHRPYRTPE